MPSTPPLSFYRPDAVPAAQLTVSKHCQNTKPKPRRKLKNCRQTMLSACSRRLQALIHKNVPSHGGILTPSNMLLLANMSLHRKPHLNHFFCTVKISAYKQTHMCIAFCTSVVHDAAQQEQMEIFRDAPDGIFWNLAGTVFAGYQMRYPAVTEQCTAINFIPQIF